MALIQRWQWRWRQQLRLQRRLRRQQQKSWSRLRTGFCRIVISLLTGVSIIHADPQIRPQAPPPVPAPAPPSASNDVEAETDGAEQERTTPSIFLKVDTSTPTLDSLVYQRADFNDYLKLDAKQRLRYR